MHTGGKTNCSVLKKQKEKKKKKKPHQNKKPNVDKINQKCPYVNYTTAVIQ